jgi:ribonuclease HIII
MKTFKHKPSNEPIDVFVSYTKYKPTVNIVYQSLQLVFLIRNADVFIDFFKDITDEWVQHSIESSNKFLIDEGGILDQFVITLN